MPHTNRLVHETSPYLLQHAHNPVDWYPWGPEALERARKADRPILLSIGYSACHWCHVMERESFEDAETARIMNEHFVNIKVDREERPDLDAIYMAAVQAMTGHGGWPLTVFLTPEGVPFFGGTYFPPVDRQGMPAFQRILRAIADTYRNRRGDVDISVQQVRDFLQRQGTITGTPGPLSADLLERAAHGLLQEVDWTNGGFGRAPKFPQPMNLEFLLRCAARTGSDRARQAIDLTLTRMARGGIYDQIGGGFHRYAVDNHWLVPHFEKMLYDNAQLASLYLAAYQHTGA
ncbi:MAG: thioredoxin domain-containing protein, partial [Chloroflexi bacterium]|nr:thioredoxin domain-containing protein [Chloroflexota bacterium]